MPKRASSAIFILCVQGALAIVRCSSHRLTGPVAFMRDHISMTCVNSSVRFGFNPAEQNRPCLQDRLRCQDRRLPKRQRDSRAIPACHRLDIARFSFQPTSEGLPDQMISEYRTFFAKPGNAGAEKSYASVAKDVVAVEEINPEKIPIRGALR